MTAFAVPDHVQRRLDKKYRDEYGPLPRPGIPVIDQSREVEEAWWARVFAERGMTDPALVAEDIE